MRFPLILALILTFLRADDMPIQTTVSYGPVQFTAVQNGESNRRYIWLHGDEKTAEMALKYHIKHNRGTAFFIHSDDRVVLADGLKLDPNRIFSTKGTKKTLLKYHPKVSKNKKKAIVEALDKERETFLEELLSPEGSLVVALHNNFRGYSIDSEIENAVTYSVKPGQRRQDFFLCTDRADYEILSKSPFNVVLQSNDDEFDDGSLSRLMGRKGVRYVNIEVKLGWLSQQKKMLKYLENYLP